MVQVGMPTQKACLLELSPAALPQMTDKPNVPLLLLFMLRPPREQPDLRDIYVHDPSPSDMPRTLCVAFSHPALKSRHEGWARGHWIFRSEIRLPGNVPAARRRNLQHAYPSTFSLKVSPVTGGSYPALCVCVVLGMEPQAPCIARQAL